MKLNKKIYGVVLGALSLTLASCYNADREFPDFEGGTTAYFAYQFPVRTLVLGNDIYDNALDNAHKCRIWSTMGGAYNGRDAYVEVGIDESLCDNLFFTDAGGNASDPVLPMPKSYYKLLSNTIPYNGDVRGYVEVEFTDAFFNDPKAVENTYVIPVVMKSVRGIDHILTGAPREGLTPSRTNLEDWEVLAKDYVLYCVRYMNPWQARYIRRGLDVVTENGVTKDYVRKDLSLVGSDPGRYTENPVNANDEVCSITTIDMKKSLFPITVKRNAASAASIPCNLILTFDGNKCTVTSEDELVVVSGNGEFIANGTDQATYKDYRWGSMNGEPVSRDILRLSYNVTVQAGKLVGYDEKGNPIYLTSDVESQTTDTLVVQTRESNKKVFFDTKYVK